jgi:hypothetical protein
MIIYRVRRFLELIRSTIAQSNNIYIRAQIEIRYSSQYWINNLSCVGTAFIDFFTCGFC